MGDELSRREALVGGAAVAGAALAVTAVPREAAAQQADVGALNALLTAEYRAIKAYTAGAGVLMMPPMGDPMASAAPLVFALASHFQSQHRDHATRLAAFIRDAGGTPVDEASVLFNLPGPPFRATVSNVIKLAANEEKGAAIAYAESLKRLSSQTAAEIVAAIGGVETQHFIILYLVSKGVAAPTMMVGMMANDVVPRSFVAAVGTGTMGLETVPDFTY